MSAAADGAFGAGALERAEQGGGKRRPWFRRSVENKSFTNEAKTVLEGSAQLALSNRHKEVTGAHVIAAALNSRTGPVARYVSQSGINVADLQASLLECVPGPQGSAAAPEGSTDDATDDHS